MNSDTLLIIGVHRAERDFGCAVAAALAPNQVDVLKIPEGLSGEHPRPDEVFRYQATHRALYGQLLAHVRPWHRLLIDLHTGFDSQGPCADLFTASAALRQALDIAMQPPLPMRIWPLGSEATSAARTVVPPRVWNNPDFDYVALEIYLPESAPECVQAFPDHEAGVRLTEELITRIQTARRRRV